MEGYRYLSKKGVFQLENPELNSYLYFPIANESGVMSSVTPVLGGDSKLSQNTFLLPPVSSEDLHTSKATRNFWCNITGKGIWSATGKSAIQEANLFTGNKDETRLEAGPMWHKITRTSKHYGISSNILSFVPYIKETVELMVVTLKNTGMEALTLSATAAIPLYARSADNIRDHRNVTSMLHRIETTRTGVVINPTLTFDERGHRKNEVVYGVFGTTEEDGKPLGFYPIVEDFIGEGGSLENPKAILANDAYVMAGTRVDGYEALGGITFPTITLAPEGEKTYLIVMGYGTTKENLEQMAAKYATKESCLTAFEETKKYWEEKINVSYQTGAPDFDAWMQWVNFQPMLRRIYGCSFLPHHDYGRGGRGWRDLWQDCLALLIMNPSGVRDMIISNFAGVRMDGTNATIIGSGQGEFIADRNNITRVWMDHGVWPLITTRLYIMQSGDLDILLRKNNYFKDPQAVRGEEKDDLWKPEQGCWLRTKKEEVYQGSLLEHILIEHLTQFYDVGEHNHMRLRGADWNDALDMAKERGESVAFTAIYGSNMEQLAELIMELKSRGNEKFTFLKEMELLLNHDLSLFDNVAKKQDLLTTYCNTCRHTISGEFIEITGEELAANLLQKAAWIRGHILQSEWITNKEGHSWFNSYYDNHGRRVEGDHEHGVRMMLTGQVFTIMSRIATDEQVKEIVRSSDAYLYDSAVGGYKLNTNFHEVKEDLGRMFGFAYGHKENGAVFAHMAIMYANALYQRGFVAEGYKAINSLYQHCNNFKVSKIYPGIPEYIGPNGRGLYHYLTGSASWLLLTVITEMFGVKGWYGDLLLEPKLLLEQFDEKHEASIQLIFAERKLTITFTNPQTKEFNEYQIQSILMNGVPYQAKEGGSGIMIQRSDLQALDASKEHVIVVELR